MTAKRRGMSLVNVIVFLLFVMMLTAQLFLFAKNAVDEAADEREMIVYRLKLDSLVNEAEEELKKRDGIVHKKPFSADYSDFYEEAEVWPKTKSDSRAVVKIYDLDYNYKKTDSFWPSKWRTNDEKVFAAMNPPVISGDVTYNKSGDITAINYRYYLIRAQTQFPEKFYGTKLMYQILVRRKEDDHTLQTLSFQEIWF